MGTRGPVPMPGKAWHPCRPARASRLSRIHTSAPVDRPSADWRPRLNDPWPSTTPATPRLSRQDTDATACMGCLKGLSVARTRNSSWSTASGSSNGATSVPIAACPTVSTQPTNTVRTRWSEHGSQIPGTSSMRVSALAYDCWHDRTVKRTGPRDEGAHSRHAFCSSATSVTRTSTSIATKLSGGPE